MRVAFFSPLPPARSGIADYSEALIESLKPLVELEVFSSAAQAFDPARFDIALYHVGNNGYHGFVYETALRHPGVVVMHESNLHHLIADLTIKRGDWDAYLRECEYEGGAAALAFAERVRKLEVGPDYEGVPMTQRILAGVARRGGAQPLHAGRRCAPPGFTGPAAVIPHGAWIPQADRNGFRHKLGLDEATPLVGIFGFLKPYKRIAESLRAFRRLLRLMPNVKMILVGEPHPEFPVEAMIRSMGLSASVRVLGFTPIEDFVGYLGACDIVLNLRFPTVGESSGTLLRSLGLGKAVMVSEVGSFQEFPDDVCLKVPVGPGEEDLIFEYLNLLVSRPEVARQLGERAKDYVARECNWATVAGAVCRLPGCGGSGRDSASTQRRSSRAERQRREQRPQNRKPSIEYLQGWATGEASAEYLQYAPDAPAQDAGDHAAGRPGDRVLEMGAYLQITPALRTDARLRRSPRLLLRETRARSDHRARDFRRGRDVFECEIDHFDAEKDPFPYPDGHFATVICGELIEHLFEDPMHLMSEVNRILKPGGHLVLTTPNIAALRGISAILQGYHPGLLPRLHPAGGGHGRGGRAAQSRIRAARDPPTAGELRLRSHAAGDGRIPRRAASRVRLGSAPAGALPAEHRTARRRHLRRGTKDRRGARAVSRLAVFMSAAYLEPDVTARRGHTHAARDIRDPQRFRRRRGARPRASASAITCSTRIPAR